MALKKRQKPSKFDGPVIKPLNVDHFLIYNVEEVPPVSVKDVSLRDQFDDVFKPVDVTNDGFLFGNVAKKNDEKVFNRNSHFDLFSITQIKPLQEPIREISFKNQFTKGVPNIFDPEPPETFQINQPWAVMAPADKLTVDGAPDPTVFNKRLDHYKVYVVDDDKEEELNIEVTVLDQFLLKDGGAVKVIVGKPELFCVPCDKQHGRVLTSIRNESAHYVIYRIKLVPPKAIARLVTTDDQFEPTHEFLTTTALYLAVPTLKVGVKVISP